MSESTGPAAWLLAATLGLACSSPGATSFTRFRPDRNCGNSCPGPTVPGILGCPGASGQSEASARELTEWATGLGFSREAGCSAALIADRELLTSGRCAFEARGVQDPRAHFVELTRPRRRGRMLRERFRVEAILARRHTAEMDVAWIRIAGRPRARRYRRFATRLPRPYPALNEGTLIQHTARVSGPGSSATWSEPIATVSGGFAAQKQVAPWVQHTMATCATARPGGVLLDEEGRLIAVSLGAEGHRLTGERHRAIAALLALDGARATEAMAQGTVASMAKPQGGITRAGIDSIDRGWDVNVADIPRAPPNPGDDLPPLPTPGRRIVPPLDGFNGNEGVHFDAAPLQVANWIQRLQIQGHEPTHDEERQIENITIHRDRVGYSSEGGCTAFLIADAHVLTAGHCAFEVGDTIDFRKETGTAGPRIEAEVTSIVMLRHTFELDFALLQIRWKQGSYFPNAPLSLRSCGPQADEEEDFFVLQYPGGRLSYAEGQVDEAVDDDVDAWFTHRVSTSAGSSGAPVQDKDGNVVGLHFGGPYPPGVGGNRALRIDILFEALPELRELVPEEERAPCPP